MSDPNPEAVRGQAAPVDPLNTPFAMATVAPEPATTPDLTPMDAAHPDRPVEPYERPTDKLWVQFSWEGLLLVVIALGVAAYFLFGPAGFLGSPGEVASLLAVLTPFLLLAMALGASLRVGTVNLAVVHLGLLSAVLFGVMSDQPPLFAVGVVAGVMAGAGVLLGLLVTVFKAPGWAASLLLAMVVWFVTTQPRLLGLPEPADDSAGPELSTTTAWIVVGVVAGLSIAGGLIGVARPVRQALGSSVDAVERRGHRTPAAFAITWLALIASCLLAGAAGYLTGLPGGANLNVAVLDVNGLALLVVALGIVLIGGTGARGRRGGVFGTLLAAIVVFMAVTTVEALTVAVPDNAWIMNYAVPFGALLLGLLVHTLLETVNRPKRIQPALLAAGTPVYVAAEPDGYRVSDTLTVPAAADYPADQTATLAASSSLYASQSADPYSPDPVYAAEPQPEHTVTAPVYVAAEPQAEERPEPPAAEPDPVYPADVPPAAPQSTESAADATPQFTEPSPAAEPAEAAPQPGAEVPPDANPYLYRPPPA